jgi:hypothetical protein
MDDPEQQFYNFLGGCMLLLFVALILRVLLL